MNLDSCEELASVKYKLSGFFNAILDVWIEFNKISYKTNNTGKITFSWNTQTYYGEIVL